MTVSGKKTPAARPKASYTVKAITTKAEDLADHRERVAEAVAWCGANRRGARAAETHFKKIWGEGVVTYNMIQPILTRLNKKSKAVVAARDHHLQLLTNDERLKVGAWIIQCADGQKPKDRTEVSEKIIEILKARARANREKGYGKGTVLNEPEKAAAKSLPGHKLTKTFFTNFYAWLRAHGVGIDEGVDRSQDAKRAAKMTEGTVQGTSTARTASRPSCSTRA